MKSAIVGIGSSGCGKFNVPALQIMRQVFYSALKDVGIKANEIDALIVCPATIGDSRFMYAHYLAAELDIKNLSFCGTTSTGGAGPVSGILLADLLIRTNTAKTVAVVAADTLASLGGKEMLLRIGKAINHPEYQDFSRPVIPLLYNRVAEWHMAKYGTKREALAAVPVLMSIQARNHPLAMNKKVFTLEGILSSLPVGSVTTVLECARPADGGGAVIVMREDKAKNLKQKPVYILGGGEASGSPFHPPEVSEEIFPAKRAVKTALQNARMQITDMRWWGIYDCFPISFLKFAEDSRMVAKGDSGPWVEELLKLYKDPDCAKGNFCINTHGGLLSYGAPWEAPAIFSIIEAVEQIRGDANDHQIENPSPALIYGNGGIFTSAAVAILSA